MQEFQRMVNDPESGSISVPAEAFLTPDKAANLANDAVEIVMAPLNVEADAFNALAAWLQDEEQRVAECLHFERDRGRYSLRASARNRAPLNLRIRRMASLCSPRAPPAST